MEEQKTNQQNAEDQHPLNQEPRNTSHEDNLEDTIENDELSVINKMEGELAELKDKYLRHVAEFDNYRKRTAREKLDFAQVANRDLMVALLEVLDDIDRAEPQIAASEDAALKTGVELVFGKLRKILESKGLSAMTTKGLDFDVENHEAITEIPAPTADLQGKVVDELQKGYTLNDKIIRHAKVVVGK